MRMRDYHKLLHYISNIRNNHKKKTYQGFKCYFSFMCKSLERSFVTQFKFVNRIVCLFNMMQMNYAHV